MPVTVGLCRWELRTLLKYHWIHNLLHMLTAFLVIYDFLIFFLLM